MNGNNNEGEVPPEEARDAAVHIKTVDDVIELISSRKRDPGISQIIVNSEDTKGSGIRLSNNIQLMFPSQVANNRRYFYSIRPNLWTPVSDVSTRQSVLRNKAVDANGAIDVDQATNQPVVAPYSVIMPGRSACLAFRTYNVGTTHEPSNLLTTSNITKELETTYTRTEALSARNDAVSLLGYRYSAIIGTIKEPRNAAAGINMTRATFNLLQTYMSIEAISASVTAEDTIRGSVLAHPAFELRGSRYDANHVAATMVDSWRTYSPVGFSSNDNNLVAAHAHHQPFSSVPDPCVAEHTVPPTNADNVSSDVGLLGDWDWFVGRTFDDGESMTDNCGHIGAPTLRGDDLRNGMPLGYFISNLDADRVSAQAGRPEGVDTIYVPNWIHSSGFDSSAYLALYLSLYFPAFLNPAMFGRVNVRSRNTEAVNVNRDDVHALWLANFAAARLRWPKLNDARILLPVHISGGKPSANDEALFRPVWGTTPFKRNFGVDILPGAAVQIFGSRVNDAPVPLVDCEFRIYNFIASHVNNWSLIMVRTMLSRILTVEDKLSDAIDILAGMSVDFDPLIALPYNEALTAVRDEASRRFSEGLTFLQDLDNGTADRGRGRSGVCRSTTSAFSHRMAMVGMDGRFRSIAGPSDPTKDIAFPVSDPLTTSLTLAGFMSVSAPKMESVDVLSKLKGYSLSQYMSAYAVSNLASTMSKLEKVRVPAPLLTYAGFSIPHGVFSEDFSSDNEVRASAASMHANILSSNYVASAYPGRPTGWAGRLDDRSDYPISYANFYPTDIQPVVNVPTFAARAAVANTPELFRPYRGISVPVVALSADGSESLLVPFSCRPPQYFAKSIVGDVIGSSDYFFMKGESWTAAGIPKDSQGAYAYIGNPLDPIAISLEPPGSLYSDATTISFDFPKPLRQIAATVFRYTNQPGAQGGGYANLGLDFSADPIRVGPATAAWAGNVFFPPRPFAAGASNWPVAYLQIANMVLPDADLRTISSYSMALSGLGYMAIPPRLIAFTDTIRVAATEAHRVHPSISEPLYSNTIWATGLQLYTRVTPDWASAWDNNLTLSTFVEAYFPRVMKSPIYDAVAIAVPRPSASLGSLLPKLLPRTIKSMPEETKTAIETKIPEVKTSQPTNVALIAAADGLKTAQTTSLNVDTEIPGSSAPESED